MKGRRAQDPAGSMIVLYNPPSSANKKPILPMSLFALGQVLEGEFEYVIVDGNLEADPPAALCAAIRARAADILAVTVMPGPQLHHMVALGKELRALFPDLTVVWGGYFPTQHFEACLSSGMVDFVIRGHGEFALLELVRALRSGRDVPRGDGLAYREREGGTIVDGGTAFIPDPRELPRLFPYHRVDVKRYVRKTFMGRRTIPHHSSYGCPFYCNFCAVVNLAGGQWKAQTAEQVADVAHHLVEHYDADAVEFYDNNFFTSEARVREFCERIRPLRLGWWGEARIDTMLKYSTRTWEWMRDSGLRMVFLGAESGSDETLARMNKGGKQTAAKALEIAAQMRHYGIVPEMSFVLGNPPDPEGDTRGTIAFIRQVKRVNPDTEIIMYMYTPVPLAGELYERAKAAGFAFPETLEGWVSREWLDFSQRRSANVPWLRDPVRRYAQNFQHVLNAYFPTITDTGMGRFKRGALRAMAAWRYHTRFYGFPYELKAAHRVFAYQRPDTSGF